MLNKYVRDTVAPCWYDFGVELLQNEYIDQLNIIEKNHPGDVQKCCTEMFKYWLQIDTEATWNKLIDALKEIRKNELAKKVENVIEGSYINL